MSRPANPPRKRGRPVGSISLTEETYRTIVNYARAGALPQVAAQAAGISERTFHDWMARGEGRHTSREPTPKLKAFARDVRQAQAQFRISMEMRVAQQDPKYYLRYAARTSPDSQGWSDLPRELVAKPEDPSEHFVSVLTALDEHDQEKRDEHEADCTDETCIQRRHLKSNNIHAGNVRCDDPDHWEPHANVAVLRPATGKGREHG